MGRPSIFQGRQVPSRPKKPRTREDWERVVVAVIRASREDADVDRKDLAARLKLTYSQIVNIENGRRAVGLVDFILLAKALKIEPEVLFKRLLSW